MEIRLEHIYKKYRNKYIFKDANITFSQTGFHLIFGKSGSGKTTLLNILAGYEGIEQGQRYCDDSLMITSILQHHELFDFMNVKDNISLYDCIFHNVDQSYAQEIIRKLHIEDILCHYPYELSQGQKQRVCIARGLLQNSNIILCDEPTEALDHGNRKIVLDMLYELSKTKCVIIATHDISSLQYKDAVVYHIKDYALGQQHVEEHTSQPLYRNKDTEKVDKQFLHSHLKQILFYKKAFYFPILCILIGILLLLNLYNTSIFSLDFSSAQFEQNQIYLQSYDKNSLNSIKNKFKTLYPIPEITSINVSYLTFNPDIHLVNDEINIDQDLLDQQILPVVISDGFSKSLTKSLELETVIGERILIQYKVGSERGLLEGVIQDIVEEPNNLNAIYFHEEQLYDVFKNINSVYENISMYDELLDKGTHYIGVLNTNNLVETYEEIKQMNGFTVMNRELDQFHKKVEYQGPYQMIYLILEVVLGIALAIFILYENNQMIKKMASGFALLSTMNVPMKDLKQISYHLLGVRLILLTFCDFGICFALSLCMELSLKGIFQTLIIFTLIILFFIFTWLLFDLSFKKKQVAYMMIFSKD